MKEVGRIWQNISKEELDYFKDKSRRDMDRYWSEHARFINQINDLRAQSKTEGKPLFLEEDEEVKEPSFHQSSVKRRAFDDWHPLFDEDLPATTPLKDVAPAPGMHLTTPSTYHDEFLASPRNHFAAAYQNTQSSSQPLWG